MNRIDVRVRGYRACVQLRDSGDGEFGTVHAVSPHSGARRQSGVEGPDRSLQFNRKRFAHFPIAWFWALDMEKSHF